MIVFALLLAAQDFRDPAVKRAYWSMTPEERAAKRVIIPNLDLSDEAVARDAKAYCGTTQECLDRFKSYRNFIVEQFDTRPERRGGIRKIIKRATAPEGVNWNEVEMQTVAKYQIGIGRGSVAGVRCTTFATKNFASTSCSTY